MRTITMPCLKLFLAALLILAAGCGGAADEDIRDSFDEYLAALRARDGARFVQVIDPHNIRNYDHIVKLAKSGDRRTVQRMPAVHRHIIIILRHRLEPEELKKLDGHSFVKMSVERDWFFGEEHGESFSLGRIKHNPPRASAELLVDREKTGLRFQFVQVGDRWLVNDECLDQWWGRIIEKTAAAARISEDEFLMRAETLESGKRVDRRILEQPPG